MVGFSASREAPSSLLAQGGGVERWIGQVLLVNGVIMAL